MPEAISECRHQIDDITFLLFGLSDLDLLSRRLPAYKLAQRVLVTILELFRIEATRFRAKDVLGEADHVLRNAWARNAFEIVLFVADFVIVPQRCPKHSLPHRLQRDD